MSKLNEERREFLKKLTLGLFSIPVVSIFSSLRLPAAWAGDTVTENEPMAVTLGYHVDASKVDTKKWPRKAAADAKNQFCNNCMFYQKQNDKLGKCQIFTNRLVASKGWCNSWTKKA
ncbi:MAG: high-potential iron-sulfur protein [Bacteriovoracia bacterium]